ncbi:hypothetical protein [Aquimarina sp. LLG6339-5]|uniref:hypothetical protein n=1 Tax=Aquimarina sp. LLG6339-5 TaxID=3160830 RepID=UPI00386BCD87
MKARLLQIILSFVIFILIEGCKTNQIDNLLEAPDTWRKEVLEFPLIFARSLPYEGEEHIRFAEGWGDKEHEEYFSYVFIWVLDTNPNLTVSKIESDMETYFTGLMKTGLLTKLRLFKKLPNTNTTFKKSEDSTSSFDGIIEVYDVFFKNEYIKLHTKISLSYCNHLKKYIVYFRVSPKSFDESIWRELNQVDIKLDCN